MTNNIFSITNAKGRQVNLLNDEGQKKAKAMKAKKRYHCTVPGCHKSFTTSGHLARHHRIHTGEKNFPCLYPGCPSRFSRQDNMMQHYRTHVSNRSRLHYYYHCHQYPYQHYNNTLSWDNNSNDEPVVYNNRREWSIFSSSSTDSSSSSSSNSHVSMNASPTYSNTEYQPTLPPIKPNLTWVHQDHSYHDTMKSKRFYFEGYA